MRKIDNEEAEAVHGIITYHQQMDNGEFRFRLKKNDGTAYIRTEACTLGAWQKSHYHRFVAETYIVQRGWIAYAELIEDNLQITIYGAGEQFTTRRGIIHNIYMPANAVIHTVKHGNAPNEDRITDDRTIHFDADTETLTEEDIRALAKNRRLGKADAAEEIYTVEYRHFDTLIWQLPAWCSAIFSIAAVGANSIQQAEFLQSATGLSASQIASGFLGLLCFVILALSHALHRFRYHQAPLKRFPPTTIWLSASVWLNLIVTVEGFCLLLIVLLLNGMPFGVAISECIALPLVITAYRELELRGRQEVTTK